MTALDTWNGGVIVISHDERFITTVAKEVSMVSFVRSPLMHIFGQLWVCGDATVTKFMGDVQSYKVSRGGATPLLDLTKCSQNLIVGNVKARN